MIILFVAIIFLLIDAISFNSSSSKKERQSVVCSAINDDESDSNDLDLDPNDSSSEERQGISSASQTVCM